MTPMNTRLEGTWLAGSQKYDTGVDTSNSVSPRCSRPHRSSIQAQILECGESSDTPNDFNEYESSTADARLDLEAASEEWGPDDLDDPWPYTFQVRTE